MTKRQQNVTKIKHIKKLNTMQMHCGCPVEKSMCVFNSSCCGGTEWRNWHYEC